MPSVTHESGSRPLRAKKLAAPPAPVSPEVFSLYACPPLEPGNFALVKRDAAGVAMLLHLGRAPFVAPTLNLALVRRRAAEMGANEIHYWRGTAGA